MTEGRPRVVVTGMGAITPLGPDVDSFWKSALAGESGISRITAFDVSDFPCQIAGEIPDFDPELYLERKEARRLDRFTHFFVGSTHQAMADAGIDYSDNPDAGARTGVVLGAGIGGIMSLGEGIHTLDERGPRRVSPYVIPQIIPNIGAGEVSILYHLLGPVTCVVTACAASANAIGDAAELIRRGAADVMIAGGSEAPIVPVALAGFTQARAVSTRNDEPERACRPFDADRDGFVMSEGAATLVLEEREHALARGARIYGELVGYGMSADAYHVTLPRPGGVGAAKSMTLALDDAGMQPADIDYINAHGTSTKANDTTETEAIKITFGEETADQVPISSTKSMTGHLLGGAGAIESIACLLAIRDGVIPPTINYETPDPECDLDYVPNEPRTLQVDTAMTNSFGFGGHNASLVFTRHS